MKNKYKETGIVIRQEEISNEVFSMWIRTDSIAKHAKPGQFISIYCNEGSRLLPRPISICEIDQADNAIRVVYRIFGNGTKEFSAYRTGSQLEILGPLGNGFPLKSKKAVLIGGGVGIPPLLELAKQLKCDKDIVLGYREDPFLDEDFRDYGKVSVATEDGSYGTEGNVLDAIREQGISGEIIYACGPKKMLQAVKTFAAENGIEAWLSLEEKMACGIGACLACVCKSKEKDRHTNVNNKRVCKDGPVFLAEEVEL